MGSEAFGLLLSSIKLLLEFATGDRFQETAVERRAELFKLRHLPVELTVLIARDRVLTDLRLQTGDRLVIDCIKRVKTAFSQVNVDARLAHCLHKGFFNLFTRGRFIVHAEETV